MGLRFKVTCVSSPNLSFFLYLEVTYPPIFKVLNLVVCLFFHVHMILTLYSQGRRQQAIWPKTPIVAASSLSIMTSYFCSFFSFFLLVLTFVITFYYWRGVMSIVIIYFLIVQGGGGVAWFFFFFFLMLKGQRGWKLIFFSSFIWLVERGGEGD
jgi:hypothetical protein